MNNAAIIAQHLRGKASGEGFLCHCPVPSHGRGRGDQNPSLLIKDGDQAVLFKCLAGCDTRDVLQELRARGLYGRDSGPRPHKPDAQQRPEPPHLPDPNAAAIWKDAVGLPGTIAEQYFAARGISPPIPPTIRFRAASEYGSRPPAIVAAVQAPHGPVVAVQVTTLAANGSRKADIPHPRKTIGALGRGAVRLAAATAQLGIAEGVEKALAAMQINGVPCWATLGSGRMHRVWVPDTVGEIHVFGDNDHSGRAAAGRTAQVHRHRRVIFRFPPDQFKDWDDVTAALEQGRSPAK